MSWQNASMENHLTSCRRFWNSKARENPYWYVSSYGPYKDRNLDEFWASGEQIWNEIKQATGYRPQSVDHVVEIGCGLGRITRAIAKDAGKVDAFDISPEMIHRAKQNGIENVNFQVNDGASLDLPPAWADAVVAYCVFQHLPSLRFLGEYLRETMRVAKPGALIAFTTCARNWKDTFLGVMRAKAFLKGMVGLQPAGLHSAAWLGIRPSRHEVESVCPFPLAFVPLKNDRWLYYGEKGS